MTICKDSIRWHSTFLGVRQQHCYGLYRIIDSVLNNNQQIRKFVEIGTGGGALSVFLGLHAYQRGSHLLTLDIQERAHLHKVKSIFELLNIEMLISDCFSPDSVLRIINYIDNTPCFFFCDGGDKPREFNSFAPALPKGSIIAAHDYNTKELKPEQIAETVNALNLTPLMEEEWTGGVDDIRTCFYLI